MKKTLLIGLAAVTLGSMTACSNILEEEGTIKAPKMGELTVSVNDSKDVSTKTEDACANYIVNVAHSSGNVEIPTTLKNVEYSTLIGKNIEMAVADGYIIEVKSPDYPETVANLFLAENWKHYIGTQTFNIEEKKLTPVNVTCKRPTATFAYILNDPNSLLSEVSIQAIVDQTTLSVPEYNQQMTNELHALSGKNVTITLRAKYNNTDIAPVSKIIENVAASTLYKVSYSLTTAGSFTVNVNTTINEVSIEGGAINPY